MPTYLAVRDGSPDGIVTEYPDRFHVPPRVGMKIERQGKTAEIRGIDYVNAECLLDNGQTIKIRIEHPEPQFMDGWGAVEDGICR